MKSINIYFDDDEYKFLKEEKDKRKVSWRELILLLLRGVQDGKK